MCIQIMRPLYPAVTKYGVFHVPANFSYSKEPPSFLKPKKGNYLLFYYTPEKGKHIVSALSVRAVPCLANSFKTTDDI